MTDYYVKTDGDNGDSGLDWDNAWLTVTYAVSQATTPGDTVTFADGTYNVTGGESGWTSGTSGNPITFQAENSRGAVWQLFSWDAPLTDLTGGEDYITFDGIVFNGDYPTRSSFALIYLGGNTNLIFNDCELTQSRGHGVYCNAGNNTDISFIGCEIHLEYFNDAEYWEGMLIRNSGNTNWLIENCQVYHTNHTGIMVYGCDGITIINCEVSDTGSHCIQIGGANTDVDNVVIDSCLIHDAEGYAQGSYLTGGHKAVFIFPDGSANRVKAITVQRCDIYKCAGSGIEFYDLTVGPLIFQNNTFYHNNTYGNLGYNYGEIHGYTPTSSPTVDIRNNVFFSDGVGHTLSFDQANTVANLTCNNNILYTDGAIERCKWNTTEYTDYATYIAAHETDTLDDNPDLTNPGAYDFTLQVGSPCIDTGVNVGLPYSGSAPDMGAHELGEVVAGVVIVMIVVTITVMV